MRVVHAMFRQRWSHVLRLRPEEMTTPEVVTLWYYFEAPNLTATRTAFQTRVTSHRALRVIVMPAAFQTLANLTLTPMEQLTRAMDARTIQPRLLWVLAAAE
jgi:hypothetical protein